MFRPLTFASVSSAFLLSSVAFANKDQLQVNAGSDDDLARARQQCEEAANNPQTKAFTITAECRLDSFTYWQKEEKTFSLENASSLRGEATTKRFTSIPGVFDHALPAQTGTCAVYTKRELISRVPVTITLDSCSDIEGKRIADLCAVAIEENCADTGVTQKDGQQQQSQSEGCSISTVQVVDTCQRASTASK